MKEHFKRINAAIEKSGYSYPELAKITGISKSSLQRYATGETKKIPIDCIEKIAKATNTDSRYLMGWNDNNIESSEIVESSNINYIIQNDNIYQIPVFESVSAGFGAYASNEILEYIPVVLNSRYEAENTLAIKVKGDSMYPKIEDGDTIIVRKQNSVDSGDIAVLLLDGEEGLVKKVLYGKDWIELHSINPEYKNRRFEKEEVLRLQVVGKVIGSYKSF